MKETAEWERSLAEVSRRVAGGAMNLMGALTREQEALEDERSGRLLEDVEDGYEQFVESQLGEEDQGEELERYQEDIIEEAEPPAPDKPLSPPRGGVRANISQLLQNRLRPKKKEEREEEDEDEWA